MDRTTIWELKVCWWPRAVEAGAHPRPDGGFSEDPACYRPYAFLFAKPPSREDFRALRRRLPWTSCWDDELRPLIDRHPWPTIDGMHKAASVDLVDDRGRRVGSVGVSRLYVEENAGYPCGERAPDILVEHARKVERRLARLRPSDGGREFDAYHAVMVAENAAREELSLLDRPPTDAEIVRALERAAGLKPAKGKRKAPTG